MLCRRAPLGYLVSMLLFPPDSGEMALQLLFSHHSRLGHLAV